jgi:putative transposase
MVTDMPRPKRICPAGNVFHVLNRAVARLTIFEKPDDYDAFMCVLDETWRIVPLPIFAMVAMPNHWHFVVRPDEDDQVSEFFRRLTVTHTMRWHAHYETGGTGHLYQGRFKSFPVQDDEHLLRVLRYVERNPLRANLVERAEDWHWGSAWARRQRGSAACSWLDLPGDPPMPRQWRAWVNKPQTEAEVNAIRHCIRRGTPYGSDHWVRSSAVRLGLESTLRPRGRPKKHA